MVCMMQIGYEYNDTPTALVKYYSIKIEYTQGQIYAPV